MNYQLTQPAQREARSAPPIGYAANHVISERLATLQAQILDAKEPKDLETKIVWNLFGTISQALKNRTKDRKSASWLLAEIESILSQTSAPTNK